MADFEMKLKERLDKVIMESKTSELLTLNGQNAWLLVKQTVESVRYVLRISKANRQKFNRVLFDLMS